MWSAECGMDARATERSATINSALRIPHSALSAQPSNIVGCSALRGGVKPKCLYAPAVAQRPRGVRARNPCCIRNGSYTSSRSEEHTSELQSHSDLVCRLLLEKKKQHNRATITLLS